MFNNSSITIKQMYKNVHQKLEKNTKFRAKLHEFTPKLHKIDPNLHKMTPNLQKMTHDDDVRN